MNEQPLLTVRGEAFVEVDPEIAQIAVTFTARDADRAKALRVFDERAGAVDKILARFGDAIEKIETSGVRISPQFKNSKPQERVSAYVAVVHHRITVADFDRLGELVAQLADQDLVEVDGPWWALRPTSPVHRRVRVEAVGDAVQRARDYAEALGAELTDLVEVADARLLSDSRGWAAPMLMASGRHLGEHRSAAPDEFTFDISPAKQTVQATVEARFRMTAPILANRPGPPTGRPDRSAPIPP